jgi:DNA-binding transcriptional regulator YiaG
MGKLSSIKWPKEKLDRLSVKALNARVRLRLTQQEAAREMGIPYDAVRRFETAKSPTPHAYTILKYFQIPED